MQLRPWDTLTDYEKACVNSAFEQCQKQLEADGRRVTNDDRAERLIDAIARYLQESKRA